VEDTKEFEQIDNELKKEQLTALRHKQFEMAMNGDVRLLIWLGKQYLGQKDNPEVYTEELCDGFDLEEIDSSNYRPFDKIVFKECDSKCNCVDCGKGQDIEMGL